MSIRNNKPTQSTQPGRSELDSIAAVVEIVSAPSTRFAYTVGELANELATLGKHGADWPQASATQWRRTIVQGIASGLIVVDDNEQLGPKATVEPMTQLELFE